VLNIKVTITKFDLAFMFDFKYYML